MLPSRLALVLFAVLLIPAATFGQPDPNPWRFVHPNAKAIVGIDWKRVRQSHVGVMLREKLVDTNPMASAIPGIEFLDDIDRVVISSSGRDAEAGDEKAEAPVLISLRGHFDLAKVRKVLAAHKAKPQMFNSIQVYRPQDPKSKDLAIVLLDPQNILLGDAHSVFSNLEPAAVRPNSPGSNALLMHAAQMESTYDIWAILNTPGALASDRLMDMFTGTELNAPAKGVEFGVSLRTGLLADITVAFESDAAAKKLTSELSKMLKLVIKDKMGEPAMLDIEKHLKFSSEGSNAKISLRMTPQDVDKNARIFSASRKPVVPGPVADARPLVLPVPLPAPLPPKPENKVIRIEGLDEGTREIPYKPPGQQIR